MLPECLIIEPMIVELYVGILLVIQKYYIFIHTSSILTTFAAVYMFHISCLEAILNLSISWALASDGSSNPLDGGIYMCAYICHSARGSNHSPTAHAGMAYLMLMEYLDK